MAEFTPRTLEIKQFWKRGDFLVFVQRIADHGETSPHDHVFHEIVFVESGTADHLTVAGTRKLHPGDVIILQPRVWHGYQNPKSLTIINCLFDGSLLRQYGAVLSLLRGSFQLFRRRSRHPAKAAPIVLHARPAQRARLLRGFEAMMEELRERPHDWQAEVTVRLLDCLVTIARLDTSSNSRTGSAFATRTEEALVEATDYLETHFTEPVMLGELAGRLSLSPTYLSRCFSRHMGMGIIEYLHHLRIEEACRLLRYSDESIGEIAGRVGYDEVAYFSRCFRAQIGSAPREYRSTYKSQR